MKTKLLKKIRKRFSWKWGEDDLLWLFDEKDRRAYANSTSTEAVLKIASECVSFSEYCVFSKTRSERRFIRTKRHIQKQHK